MMFGREIRSKLPEVKRETVGVPGEDVRERDWFGKLTGKAYADLKRGATPKSIRIGNTILLRDEKMNKLSTNFNHAPFKVVQKTVREVTLRNEAGVELKRNCICTTSKLIIPKAMATKTKWYRQILRYIAGKEA